MLGCGWTEKMRVWGDLEQAVCREKLTGRRRVQDVEDVEDAEDAEDVEENEGKKRMVKNAGASAACAIEDTSE